MTNPVVMSIKDRLLRGAKLRGEEFELTLSRFASERFLFRLGESACSEQCVLKGASLLSIWLDEPYRATRDVDLLVFGRDDDDAIRLLLEEICVVQCAEDGLEFDLKGMRIDAIRPEDEYSGKRARFVAFLGTARIRMQVDFGFGDAGGDRMDRITYPTILDDMRPPSIRAYPQEATIAEKFEAMVKLDTRNSRMKDFHDVFALAGSFAFDGAELRQAVAACFERRRTAWTQEVPIALTPAFYTDSDRQSRWSAYVRGRNMIAAPPTVFVTIGERVIEFLRPVRHAIVASEPFNTIWPAAGPWSLGDEL